MVMLDMSVLDVLYTFKTEKSLASHHEYCKSHEAIQIELPEKGSKISFKNHNRSMRVPFIGYDDFESFTPPADFVTTPSVLTINSILKNQLLL